MGIETRRLGLVTVFAPKLLSLAAFVFPLSCFAQPQPFPSRAITIVVPFTPATGADVIARLLQPKLTENLKVPVVVDNKPGASSAIGTEFVARSPADGYTLLFTATSHGTLPATKRSLPYDPVKSVTPVA